VRGILGSSPERTREAVRELKVDHAYSSLDDLVRDPNVSAIHICTPNYVHFEQSKAALEAGKRAMCEKPLAMDTGQSHSLIELSRKLNPEGGRSLATFVITCFVKRPGPSLKNARSANRASFTAASLQDWLLYPTDWNWRLQPELGGDTRVVADIGTHWLDLLT